MQQITDKNGVVVIDAPTLEPPAASIVILQGETGLAYQKFFDDGLWYPSGRGIKAPRKGKAWAEILSSPRAFLVYAAPERNKA